MSRPKNLFFGKNLIKSLRIAKHQRGEKSTIRDYLDIDLYHPPLALPDMGFFHS